MLRTSVVVIPGYQLATVSGNISISFYFICCPLLRGGDRDCHTLEADKNDKFKAHCYEDLGPQNLRSYFVTYVICFSSSSFVYFIHNVYQHIHTMLIM